MISFRFLNRPIGFVFFLICAGAPLLGLAEEKNQPAGEEKNDGPDEDIVRLQVFLDRSEFAPGKIDGRKGEFTRQALALYRESKGMAVPETQDAKDLDLNGLDLESLDPLFIDYKITESDLTHIGDLPEEVPKQAEGKDMPYRSAAEAVAEKFHTSGGYFEELNEGKTDNLKVGDVVRVPNVNPFILADVIQWQSETEAQKKEDKTKKEDESEKSEKEQSELSLIVDTHTNMLKVYESEKLIAAYPVTIGSGQTESPKGAWKVTAIVAMPEFRYDKSMLKHGVRSSDFHLLPPGPNNPVGVFWIQLNKEGIGLHGTNNPDSIGRSESHGCVRLANWDVARVASRLKASVPVEIN